MDQSGVDISTSGSVITRSEPDFAGLPPRQTSRRLILQDQGAYLDSIQIEFLTFSRSFFEIK